jgi:hypothetical protein
VIRFIITVTDKFAFVKGPIPISKFKPLAKFFESLGFPMIDAVQGSEIGATIYATTQAEIDLDRELRGMKA